MIPVKQLGNLLERLAFPPLDLLEQLAVGGRLVLPVGGLGVQYLQTWDRTESGYQHEAVVPVAFVPLRGEFGFDKDWYEK